MKNLRIVHCGIFNEFDDGNFFYGLERKISHGLHQNRNLILKLITKIRSFLK